MEDKINITAKNKLSSVTILILSVTYVFYTFLKSSQDASKSIELDNRFFVYLPIIICIITLYGIFKNIVKINYISKLFIFYSIGQTILLIVDTIQGNLAYKDYANTYIPAILPPLIFVYFYICLKKRKIKEEIIIKTYVFSLLLFSFIYIYYWLILQYNLAPNEQGALNTSYFIILLLPPCLLINNKLIKYLFITLVFIIVCSSLKRGGIIAYTSSIIGYFILSFIFGKKKKINTLIALSILITFSPYLFKKVDNIFDNRISTRFQNIQEDSGSGRLDIYNQIINSMEKSSFPRLIFGNGGDAVRRKVTHEFTAHNDFIEITYNYGFIMLIILLLIHLAIIKKVINCIKINSKYAFPLTYTYIIFLIFSLISHIIIYPYFILLLPFWALVFTNSNNTKKINTNENRSLSLPLGL